LPAGCAAVSVPPKVVLDEAAGDALIAGIALESRNAGGDLSRQAGIALGGQPAPEPGGIREGQVCRRAGPPSSERDRKNRPVARS